MAKFYTRLTLLIIAITILVPPNHGKVVERQPPTRADFTYLGSSSSRKAGPRHSLDMAISTSEYYLSHSNAEWETANEDCMDIFGDRSSLVNLETREEFTNLTNLIGVEGNLASHYWIGGMYEDSKGFWQWTNGFPVGGWAPWENGKPGTESQVSRIGLRLSNSGPQFRSQFNTVPTRYICEIELQESNAQKGFVIATYLF